MCPSEKHACIVYNGVEENLFVKYYHITKGNAPNKKKRGTNKETFMLCRSIMPLNRVKFLYIMSRRYTIFESNKSCIRFEK